MPALHKNRVKMTVTSAPGTSSPVTLVAASTGHQSFATAYGANATVDVLLSNGTDWEVQRGVTYTHSGTTVSRGTPEASSNSGSLVNFSSATNLTVEEIATAGFGNSLESALLAVTPGGRLTLESGVPVSTTDQTAKTSIYYTPYVHNIINLWDGANWVPTTFTEYTLALGTLTSGKPYDVFAYLNAGALALEVLVWTNDTTRATAVTLQDGRYCKSGDKTRLLLGTFYTTSTTTTEDSVLLRYVSNVYNREPRALTTGAITAASHTYATGTWREWNAGTSVTRLNWVDTLPGQTPIMNIFMDMKAGDAGRISYGSIYLDTTSGDPSESISNFNITYIRSAGSKLGATPSLSVGKHYATPAEYAFGGNCDFNVYWMSMVVTL